MTVHEAHTRVLLGDLQVPAIRVALTNGETFDRYATEGPGSDPGVGSIRARARPVLWLPGSSDSRTGWSSQSSARRSTIRIANGYSRCTRARSAARSFLARFSLHGISGWPLRSRTKTDTSRIPFGAATLRRRVVLLPLRAL